MTDLPISRQALRSTAALAVHVFLDHPGITLQDAELWLRRRIDRLSGRTVWLGSTYGPESSAKAWEHKRRPMQVGGHKMRPIPACVSTIGAAVDVLKRRGDLAVLLNNVHRFVMGLWVPSRTADWLRDGPLRRSA